MEGLPAQQHCAQGTTWSSGAQTWYFTHCEVWRQRGPVKTACGVITVHINWTWGTSSQLSSLLAAFNTAAPVLCCLDADGTRGCWFDVDLLIIMLTCCCRLKVSPCPCCFKWEFKWRGKHMIWHTCRLTSSRYSQSELEDLLEQQAPSCGKVYLDTYITLA